MSRITLGTVQFGMDYGISNREGKTPDGEASLILEEAINSGIYIFDTAYDYGESEKILGRFIKTHKDAKVISKLPVCGSRDVEGIFTSSADRLGIASIYGYLIHGFKSYSKDKKVWEELRKIKDSGRVEKIGFSLYRPRELDSLMREGVEFDIVQVPYSIFDRRFERHIDALKDAGVEIYARSVFLQGLAFMDPSELPENLSGAASNLDKLHNTASKTGIPSSAICLNYVLHDQRIDNVIIGVNNLRQLKENLSYMALAGKANSIYGELAGLAIDDEDVVLPYRWRR